MKKFLHVILGLSVAALAGCVVIPAAPGMGDKEDAKAPRLVNSDKKDAQGRFLPTWDRPGAFAKVAGKPIAGGGFLCAVKPN